MHLASGTPSAREITAMARLAAVGWHVRVRADFDAAGLAHVRALLAGIPGSTPWRMGTADYKTSLPPGPQARLDLDRLPETPWEPALADAMRAVGSPAFEEAFMPQLLADLRAD
jgi:hypothetical protein